MIKGADFSSYQTSAAVEHALAQGIRFAFVKLTEGSGYLNPEAGRQLELLHAHGLKLGVYHYLDAAGLLGQWHQFQAHLEQLPHHQELLVAIDYEQAGTTDKEAAGFIADGRAAGYRVGLYSSSSTHAYSPLGEAWRWVAKWSPGQPRSCSFWQFAAGQGGAPDWDVYVSPLPLATFWERYAGRHLERHYRVRFAGAGKLAPVTLGPYKTLRRAALVALAYAVRHPKRPSFTVSRV